MHARFCSPVTGRFLSVDPKARRRAAQHAQLWNRYSVARGNPMKHVDPDGREGVHYQNVDDQKFYQEAYRRNGDVRAVFDQFGPGSGRELNVNRGDPGKHRGGFPLGARTDVTMVQTEVPQADAIEAYNKGGEAAAKELQDGAPYELKEATIILSDQASDKDRLHEVGHVEQALNDPEGFLQDSEAADKATTPQEYEATKSEVYANDFAKKAKKKDKEKQ